MIGILRSDWLLFEILRSDWLLFALLVCLFIGLAKIATESKEKQRRRMEIERQKSRAWLARAKREWDILTWIILLKK